MIKRDRNEDEVFLAQVRWHGFEFVPAKRVRKMDGVSIKDGKLRGVLIVKREFVPGLQTVTVTTGQQEKRYEEDETPTAQDIQDTVEPLMKTYPLGSELSVKKVVIQSEDTTTSKKWVTTYFELESNTTGVPDFHKHLTASLLELSKTPDNTESTLASGKNEDKFRPGGKKARKLAAQEAEAKV